MVRIPSTLTMGTRQALKEVRRSKDLNQIAGMYVYGSLIGSWA
ncbi:MAG TPA: hypothetical protein VN239_02840 [Nitrososphaera sp.]|nr:hypothetical protein [Nitrososphaera sp.]